MKKMIFTLAIIGVSAFSFTSCDKENDLLKNYDCFCEGIKIGVVTEAITVSAAEAACLKKGQEHGTINCHVEAM